MKNEYKTRGRKLILDYLMEHSNQRFTAADIYENINSEEENINRTTVYRNLDRLCAAGTLLKFKESDSDVNYYQYSSDHDHCESHMHAQCVNCGKVYHLEKDFVQEFSEQLSEAYGIQVDLQKTVIAGQCKDCRNNGN